MIRLVTHCCCFWRLLNCKARVKPRMLYVMPRLTQAPNLAIATLWADALATEGIATSVQRQYLGSVAGELPPDQCLPEVWIAYPEQETLARKLLYDLQHVPQHRWHCTCGELVEGGFEQCWNCAALMPL
jgi:hypothetical protein